MAKASDTQAQVFHYHVITVSKRFPMRNQSLRTGESAQQVRDDLAATGNYRSVEVAPASPVNGYAGLAFKAGDTAGWKA